MKKIGVVCFDNFESLSAGWASVSGSEPKRINGIGDLSSSVIWISNLPFYYYKRLNLFRSPNIYDHQFFRTSLKLLSEELGLSTDTKMLCKHSSQIFQRTYDLGLKDYRLSLESKCYRYNTELMAVSLPSNVRQSPSGNHAFELVSAFKGATQQNQAMVGMASKGTKSVSFAFPKGAYARTLLSLDFPNNEGWKKIQNKNISTTIGTKEDNEVAGTKAFLKYCNDELRGKSVFFKADVVYTSKFFRSFASFAVGSNHQRGWISMPELMQIVKYSVVSISEAFVGESYKIPFDNIDLDSDEYSLSRGLYLENLWTSLSLPIVDGTKYEYYNPVGAYIRAYDRMMCLKAAYAFARNNFTVGSFGTGRVIVYVKEHEKKAAKDIGISEGLLPPAYMVNGNG